MTDHNHTDARPYCPNCGGRGYIGGRTRLPNGDHNTRTPCYMCSDRR